MKTVLKAGVRVPADVPTVGLHVQVSTPMGPTGHWNWASIDGCAPHAVERLHTKHELDRALRSYGATVGAMLVHAANVSRFRMVARGLFTGRLLGQFAFHWDPLCGRYQPEAEPWIVWTVGKSNQPSNPSAPHFPGYTVSGLSRYVRAMSAEETQGLPRIGIDLRSTVRPLHAIPPQIPHVRDKEDVPHEDALPDLYGLPSGEVA